MTPECSRVMDALGGPLPPELATHAASCPDCRALTEGFGVLDAPAAAPVPPPAPKKLEAARTKSLSELRAQPQPTPWWRELLASLHEETSG